MTKPGALCSITNNNMLVIIRISGEAAQGLNSGRKLVRTLC